MIKTKFKRVGASEGEARGWNKAGERTQGRCKLFMLSFGGRFMGIPFISIDK